MNRFNLLLLVLIGILALLIPHFAFAQLQQNFYYKTCPNVEKIVNKAVKKKINETFVTIPATIRLFFHDCMVNGCDASVMIASTTNNTAEKDHPDNESLAGDGFDMVIKAKAAVDAVPRCKNKVSCADILAIATRDAINSAGGPYYPVELGRKDGLVSTAASINGRLPQPTFNLNQLTTLFNSHGLSQADMIALSGAHTLGFSHCSKFTKRLYNFSSTNAVDPNLNPTYAAELKKMCPENVDPRTAVNMDPTTPFTFDNKYYRNLMRQKGLFTSDQVLHDDPRSRPLVADWAQNATHFNQAFIHAMTKLGRVAVKTGNYGNIRHRCDAFNY